MGYEKQGKNFLRKYNIGFQTHKIGYDYPEWDKEHQHCKFVIVFSKFTKIDLSIEFWQSIVGGENRPSPYDILSCIIKSDPGTFEEFCDTYGYNNDSIKDQRTYEKVSEEWEKVSKFFTEEQIKELQEIN